MPLPTEQKHTNRQSKTGHMPVALGLQNVYLQEEKDGSISLEKFKMPDGEYNRVTIVDRDGDTVSANNKIIKQGRTIKLFRRYEGSKVISSIPAQTYTFPRSNITDEVIDFILKECPTVCEIFFHYSPHKMERIIYGECIENNICDSGDKKNGHEEKKGLDSRVYNKRSIVQPVVHNVDFVDVLEFEERYIIVKGFMQVGKTKFIISAAVWFLLQGKSSIVIVRNFNGDKSQLEKRVKDFNNALQKFLGQHKGKFGIFAVSGNKIKPSNLDGTNPRIIVCIGNETPLKKVTEIVESDPKYNKKYVTFIDEVDYVYSDSTLVKDQLDIIRQHSFCTFGVSATVMDELLRDDIDKGNIILLPKPVDYKGVSQFQFIHLPFPATSANRISDNVAITDPNLMWYMSEFCDAHPYYVELYDNGDDYNSCHHPIDSLVRVSTRHDPNYRLLSHIAHTYSVGKFEFPVMYFAGGRGAGTVFLYLPSEKNPITLTIDTDGNKDITSTSTIIENIKLSDSSTVPGPFHKFRNASPAIVKEWLKNSGGGCSRFPRIMTLAGGMAARCQSFGAADFSECLRNRTLPWALTEAYMLFTDPKQKKNSPELLQVAGRLCVVTRDNIQRKFFAVETVCKQLIQAYWAQEEIIDRLQHEQRMRSMKKIIQAMPLQREKVSNKCTLTRKVDFTLNLVSKEEDSVAGGWNMKNRYCCLTNDGKRIEPSRLDIPGVEERINNILREKGLDVNETFEPVLLEKDEFDRLVHMFAKWSKEQSRMSKFLNSLDPHKVYTTSEIKALATQAGIMRVSELYVSRRGANSRGYGQIMEKMEGSRTRLYEELVEPYTTYF